MNLEKHGKLCCDQVQAQRLYATHFALVCMCARSVLHRVRIVYIDAALNCICKYEKDSKKGEGREGRRMVREAPVSELRKKLNFHQT